MKSLYENNMLESPPPHIQQLHSNHGGGSVMTKKKRITPEDQALFRASVDGVKPLPQQPLPATPPPPPPHPRPKARQEPPLIDDRLSDGHEATPIENDEELLFSRSGLQHNVLRKLRRGQFHCTAELDLHGLRVEEARQALSHFLHLCHLERQQCVRIIHGKGYRSANNQAVLKSKVNHWLRQHDEVLAFCSARVQHGGTGAAYVLLRRK